MAMQELKVREVRVTLEDSSPHVVDLDFSPVEK
jgi:hypothetical protein